MTSLDHLQAAEGHLELGMAQQAHEELEALGPEYQTDLRVVALRVSVYQELGQWDLMEIVATVISGLSHWLTLPGARRTS